MAGRRKKLIIEPPVLWYLVGVITADGCLSSDGRHVDITAKDGEYLETIRKAAGLSCKVGLKNNGAGRSYYRLQISNVTFYKFLLSCGLSPKKSLTQKSVNVPSEYFQDFCRGVIDGDGNIRRWFHPENKNEQWALRIYSGSEEFVIWLRTMIEDMFGVSGRILREENIKKQVMYILKYGKMAAAKILKLCYYEKALALTRKANLARECFSSRMGWSTSKTVFNLGGWRNRYTRGT